MIFIHASYGDIKETFAGYGSFVTFVKSNAKALSTAVPPIKSPLAPCRGHNVHMDISSAPIKMIEIPPLLVC